MQSAAPTVGALGTEAAKERAPLFLTIGKSIYCESQGIGLTTARPHDLDLYLF